MRPQPYPKYKPSGVEWLGEVPEHWEVRTLAVVFANEITTVDLGKDQLNETAYVQDGDSTL